MDHKNFKRGFLSKFSWYWGIVVGLFASSLLVFAAVNIITFSPDTPISSSEVNQNFSNIKQKINEVSYSVAVGIGTNFPYASNEKIPLDTILKDDAPGAYDITAKKFIVPAGEAGFYTFYFKSKASASSNDIVLYINGSYNTYIANTNTDIFSGSTTKYLNDGDYAEVYVQLGMGSSGDLIAADTVLLIKREAKL
ncbi:MAG: hypothetical protein QF441_03765 [Bacteriovoracaceae bacterium]|jgi:hypothetical protein|nr:hypothetical protein [Bacteriovoracaceae bacterium]